MATAVAIGAAVAAAAVVGRAALRAYQGSANPAWMPAGKRFLRGGFDGTMSKREAALILGIRESASKDKIKEAHRRIMLLNHPDRGGSPYIASKVNEAKELMEGKGGRSSSGLR